MARQLPLKQLAEPKLITTIGTHRGAKRDYSRLEAGDQTPSHKRFRCRSLESSDDANSQNRACYQARASCDLTQTVMLQQDIISNLMERVSALEQRIWLIDQMPAVPRTRHANLADYTPNTESSGKYICPIENCRKAFRRADNLPRHILDSKSVEHKGIASNLNQKYCFPCQKDFKRSSDFTRHERNNHEELYRARLNWLEKGHASEHVTRILSEYAYVKPHFTLNFTTKAWPRVPFLGFWCG